MRTKILYGLIVAILLTAALWSPVVHDLASKPSFARPILVALVGTAEAVTADYQCDGVADDVQVQQAVNALPAGGGEVVLLAGTYNFTATVSRAMDAITIRGMGDSTYITYDASTPVFSASGRTGWTFADFKTDAGWVTLGTNTALINMNNNGTRTSTINGVTLSANSANATGYFSGATLVSTVATGTAPLTVTSITNVTNLNADLLDGQHASAFLLLDGTRAMTGNLSMGTYGNITLAAGMTVDGVDVSAHTHGSGNNGGQLTSPYVNEAVALTATATNLNLTDDTDFFQTALKRQLWFILTNNAYVSTLVGGGTVVGSTNRYNASTSTTANSSALVVSAAGHFVGAGVTSNFAWDWSKKAEFVCSAMRTSSDTQAIGYIQFKSASTIGALADSGVGWKFVNYQIWAESYGTAQKLTDTGVTMTSGKMYKLLILHDPTTPQDLFYVDVDGTGWVLKATHNASADVPQALETVLFRYAVSLANGATGGVDAHLGTGFTYATLYDL